MPWTWFDAQMLPRPRFMRIANYRRLINTSADGSALFTRRRLLIDVSVLRQSDTRTGIQRVVRAILIGLSRQARERFDIQPVFASRTHPYRYCDLSFLGAELECSAPETNGFVMPRKGDVFIGLDLALHVLPLHEYQI